MRQELEQAISAAIHELFDVQAEVELTRPDPQFGDYATNAALQLAKKLGKNPRELAQAIADNLNAHERIASSAVAGPGFINLTVSDTALLSLAAAQPAITRQGMSVVIETNNPNPFKAMHIGHAMNAIVADTIANLIEASGANTYRVSYHGDVGLHVGKSMYALLNYAAGDIKNILAVAEHERNSFMSKMYASGSRAYKEDEAAKAVINDLAEQSFVPKTALYSHIYETCKAWSFEQIDTTVARLGNKPTVYRFLESDADARGVAIVKKNTPKVFVQSDGAYVFEGSKYGSFDNVFVASNGRGLYGARDLGLMQLKNEQFHPEKSYIITGGEQAQYFKGVIAAAGLVDPEQKDQTVNIPTGLVKLTTGKMSSRDGDVIEIGWLFDEFKTAIQARGGDSDDATIAGALRYQFLKIRVGGDVIFDVNEAVSLTGNTGSYLQYAHARARSILAKSAAPSADHYMPSDELQPDERLLLRTIGEYSEAVDRAASELMPHYICTYLYELAQEFNRFYEKNRVLGDVREAQRLGLVALYADTLKAGLTILGIHAPEKM